MKNVTIHKKETLSKEKYLLEKVSFSYIKTDGKEVTKINEVYHPGNAVTVLLYNKQNRKVILIQQFRLPSYLNGNETGMLIEACAGKTDNEQPEVAIKREIKEETGYEVNTVEKIFEAYMTPGAVSEKLFFYTAMYDENKKVSEGGGLEEEQEHLNVLELNFDEALQLMKTGEIQDAKTIMLLQYASMNKLL
jgi:nudix-type nucleoside diphosphatase (YffH/AdpP family)